MPGTLTIGSLFSGIPLGGLELGLERAFLGRTVWQIESDPFCRSVLEKHWPDVERWWKVERVNGGSLPRADLICGGFPCQDLSVAGKMAGLEGERSGLWSHFYRIVDEHQPSVVLVENVHHGWRNWVPRVVEDLEELGYRAVAFSLAAGAVGAPHLRRRAFVVADTHGCSLRLLEQRGPGGRPGILRAEGQAEPLDHGLPRRTAFPPPWGAEPVVRRVDDGVPGRLDRDRLRALGNAVCPQVSEAIGRALREVL